MILEKIKANADAVSLDGDRITLSLNSQKGMVKKDDDEEW